MIRDGPRGLSIIERDQKAASRHHIEWPCSGVFSRTVGLVFHGAELRVVGLEDFIAMKVFAGGPQDFADARAAIAAAGDLLNQSLAKTLAQRFGRNVAETLERLIAESSARK